MLRKMYLVSPDYLSTVTSKNRIIPTPSPPPDMVRKAKKAEKKHTSSKRRRSAKKIKSTKDTPQRERDRWVAKRSDARRDYDKFVKVRAKLHEADVERKRQIMTVADFLKQVLPSAASSSPTQLKASHSWTQTEQNITS